MRTGFEEDIARRFISLCSGASPPYFFWRSPEDELLISVGKRRSFTPPNPDEWREWAVGPLNMEKDVPVLYLSFFDPVAGESPIWTSFSPVSCYQPASGVLIRHGVEHRWADAETLDPRSAAGDLPGQHSTYQAQRSDPPAQRSDPPAQGSDSPAPAADARPRDIIVPDWGEEEYRARVEAALIHLHSEKLGKVVMARQCRVLLSEPGDIRHIIRGMLRQPHSFTVCYSPDGEQYFLSATPERLGRIAGGQFETMALAGTLAGVAVLSHEDLLANRKERTEHAYVVDMIRAVVGSFATDVTTRDVRVMELPHLRHILTGISGRMRAGCGLRHAIAALHPTPAVAGTPRAEAMRLIRELEPFDRGMYAGCVGWFLGEDEGDCAVTIRSALLRGSEALLWAGAGIVRESDPAVEERETRAKLQTMLGILGG